MEFANILDGDYILFFKDLTSVCEDEVVCGVFEHDTSCLAVDGSGYEQKPRVEKWLFIFDDVRVLSAI